MASIVPGYEYDIFISYRHKDNKGDHWVTEFVNALKTELERTLKEDLSIYFDENPHDGLLETHHVDKSLEGKLKCLIFIPIISQTYCDLKSFAWEHEFCAFNKLAKEDSFGRDIKLNNGNVASRILPIKIHDLDAEDKSTIENEIGGVLRSIEFIFKSAGVNRPLRALEDHPQDNLNKTYYRDQINKVANAVKEIINSLKNPNIQNSSSTENYKATISKKKRTALLASIGIVVLLSIMGYVLYPKLASSETILNEHDRSIAVLPFVDMSPGKDQEYLGDGIADDIITTLSRIKELKVISRTSSFQFKGEKIDLRDVGEKLNVANVLEGSVIKSGNRIRIKAQLINVRDGTNIWSEQYEKEMENIFEIKDQISRAISDRLEISLLGNKTVSDKKTTTNIEAFENYLRGKHVLASTKGDEAMPFFKKAIELDSMYADAYDGLAWSYFFSIPFGNENLQKMIPLALKVEELDPESGESHALFYQIYVWSNNLWLNKWQLANEEYKKYRAHNQTPLIQHALNKADIDGDIKGGIEELHTLLLFDPINKDVLRSIARLYALDKQFDKSREMINKAIEIDPFFAVAYRSLAYVRIFEGKYLEALDGLKKVEELDSSIDVSVLRIWTLIKMGRKEDAKKIIASKPPDYYDSVTKAKFNFWLGNLDEGFRLMEQALMENDGELLGIRTNPQFDVVREDPRFKEFIKKVDFPKIE